MANIPPCPFCGSKSVYGGFMVTGYEGEQCYCIKCPDCGAIVTFDDDAAETMDDVDALYCRRA